LALSSDELNAPLGQDKRTRPSKLPAIAPQLLTGALGLFGVAVVVWTVFVKDPLGGEPTAVVSTGPLAKKAAEKPAGDGQQQAHHDGAVLGSAPAVNVAIPAQVAPPPGNKTITIIDGSSGKHEEVILPDKGSDAAPKAAGGQANLEATRQGAIPKVAADSARPFRAFAHPRQLPPDKTGAPRIAVIVGGLGISATGTADALAKLPAPVTLAIAPYGNSLDKLVERASAANHEVLLQSPMEPFDYPDNDPGPQTLLTSLTADQNIDRLHWQMSRLQGYVGIVSYMGARFTSSEPSLAPVLRETAKRGLIYVDDGASPRSVAGQLAGSHNFPFAKTDVVIDAVPTPVEIDRALARQIGRAHV
jgi:polysaccharide deacetylase 2 family uncharacterized protein YibQ